MLFAAADVPAPTEYPLAQSPGAGVRYLVDPGPAGGVILREIDREVDATVHRRAAKLRAAARRVPLRPGSSNAAVPLATVNAPPPPAEVAGVAVAGGLRIVLKQGPRLRNNPTAAAAFRAAADFVESLFSDPITVVVDAEVAPLGEGVIGQTGAVDFRFDYALFDEMRDLLAADAAPDEAIAKRLPNSDQFQATLPPDTTNGRNPFVVAGIGGSRANFKAMGFNPDLLNDGPNSAYDGSVKRDVSLTFSSNFNFDYSRDDGIADGKIDFTGVVIHEIAHGLGFLSEADSLDFLIGEPEQDRALYVNPLDLYRLKPGAGAANFTNAPRLLTTGRREPNQVFYDGGVYDGVSDGFAIPGLRKGDVPMSTGAENGDGQQASHWKDNDITDVYLGSLDPSAAPGDLIEWTNVDSRAMGLIGWDVADVSTMPPEMGSISGVAFADANANGVREAGEAGMANVSVFVDANGDARLGAGEPQTTTNAQGVYRLAPLPAGTYELRSVPPADAKLTAPASARHTVTLGAGFQLGGYSFGIAPDLASTLPAPWSSSDVGVVGTAGSARFADGTYTVAGGGADVFGAADAFRFVRRPLTGDGQIVARVASIDAADPFAKAGVMIREGTGPDARNASLFVTPSQGLRLTARSAVGGPSTSIAGAGAAPVWLRLTRVGNRCTAHRSLDGKRWTRVGARNVAMAGEVLIGLAVTSHDPTALNTSAFDNVRITTPTPLRPLARTSISSPRVPWQRAERQYEEVDPASAA